MASALGMAVTPWGGRGSQPQRDNALVVDVLKWRSSPGASEDRNYEQIQKNRREAIWRSPFEAAEERNSIIIRSEA